MKYFFDTEFIEDGKTIDLISIGIVREDGKDYYAVNYDCDFQRANEWVQGNVLIHLPFKPIELGPGYDQSGNFINTGVWRHRGGIKKDILSFVGKDEKPEFWAYYCSYDWVVLCQLFGTMMDLPKHFPMYCNDLQQLIIQQGIKVEEQQGGQHNALNDAWWVRETHRCIQ